MVGEPSADDEMPREDEMVRHVGGSGECLGKLTSQKCSAMLRDPEHKFYGMWASVGWEIRAPNEPACFDTYTETLGADWFDRHQVLWRQPGEEAWQATRTAEFWALRKAGVVHGATEVVDPLAQTVGDARSEKGMLVSAFDESWHAEMWS